MKKLNLSTFLLTGEVLRVLQSLAILSVVLLFNVGLLAQTADQPTGTGASDDPYQIATLNHLYWLSQNPSQWDKNYLQIADIDATATSAWDGGQGFSPIGSSDNNFSGYYDGDLHTISNLYINRNADYQAFFGFTTSILKSIRLTDVSITSNGTCIGGLTGRSYAQISGCRVTGFVAGKSRVGGLIGDNSGTVEACSFGGDVYSSAAGSYCGGLIGLNGSIAASVKWSYSNADIHANPSSEVGGFIGLSKGTIEDCYSKGNVTGTNIIGGFVGTINSVVSFKNCYCCGTVDGYGTTGGFAASKISGTVTSCYYDITVAPISTAAGTGKTTTEMRTKSTYLGWDFLSPIWILDTQNNRYPRLYWTDSGRTIITWMGSESTLWSTAANWDSDVVPTTEDNVIIPEITDPLYYQPSVDGTPELPNECHDLTLETNATLDIPPAKALSLSGTLNANNLYGLYLQSDATGTGSLIHNTYNVSAILEMRVGGSSNIEEGKYHLVSIPAMVTNPMSEIFLDCYLYELDPDVQEPLNNNYYGTWNSLGTSATTPLSLDKGYMIYYPGNETWFTFMEPLNNGYFDCAVTGHTGTYTFNLVPNPYPSPVNWGASDGWTKSAGIGGTCYVWLAETGNYVSLPSVTDNYIPIGQSFIILVDDEATPSLTVKNAARVHSTQTYYKSGNLAQNQLVIKAETNNFLDETIVQFTDFATPDFDLQIDGMKMYGLENAPQLYSVSGNQKYSINNLPVFQEQQTVEINFETQFAGQVTFTTSGIESFSPWLSISLNDEHTNQTINLRNQAIYTFIHNPENAAGRFKLQFGGTIGVEEPTVDNGTMWISGNTLYINNPELKGHPALVEVYNPAGQKLLSESRILDGFTSCPIKCKGFVIAKLTSGQKVLATKGFIK